MPERLHHRVTLRVRFQLTSTDFLVDDRASPPFSSPQPTGGAAKNARPPGIEGRRDSRDGSRARSADDPERSGGRVPHVARVTRRRRPALAESAGGSRGGGGGGRRARRKGPVQGRREGGRGSDAGVFEHVAVTFTAIRDRCSLAKVSTSTVDDRRTYERDLRRFFMTISTRKIGIRC